MTDIFIRRLCLGLFKCRIEFAFHSKAVSDSLEEDFVNLSIRRKKKKKKKKNNTRTKKQNRRTTIIVHKTKRRE